MADDNSVYRDLFFEESDDNLQTLNDSILELEQEPDNIDLINSIFRVAHTLKGMSATMGYDVMTKLTHKMEDMFDLFKTGKMKVNTDHISLVFKCLDKLQELVDDLRDDKELEESQITDLWNELDRVDSSAGAGEAEAPAPVEEHDEGALSTKFECYDDADTDVVNDAKAGGMNAYTIAIRLDKDTMLKGPRVFLITEHLEKDGEIIRTEPSADLLEEGDFDTDFRMIYLTKDSVDEVKSIIESNTEIDSYIVEEFKEPAAEEEKAEEKTETEEKKTEEKPVEEKKPAAKKPAAKTQAPAHKAKNQAIRVDLTRLDRFLNLVSEIVSHFIYTNHSE